MYGLLIRCTVEKQQKNSGFVRASRKRARTVRNRGFVWCIHTVHRGERTALYGFPYGERSRTVQKTVRRGTAPNRTVTYHSTEPHRRISHFSKQHRTAPEDFLCLQAAPKRTVGYITAPHRTASQDLQYLKTAPNRTVRFPLS